MTISATSTLAEVFAAQAWGPTADEVANWTATTKHLTADTVTTKVGLSSEDLTQFRLDCTTAGSTHCTPATYAATRFTGISIGINWTSSIAAETSTNGLCFSVWRDCVELTFAAPTNTYEAYIATAAISAALPSDSTNDFATLTVGDPFDSYYGTMVANSAKT